MYFIHAKYNFLFFESGVKYEPNMYFTDFVRLQTRNERLCVFE